MSIEDEDLTQMNEENNEEYEIEYGATNIINRNKSEKLEVDENIRSVEALYISYKKTYGKYNRKIKDINIFILNGKQQFEVMKEEKKKIIQEMNDVLQTVAKDEEHNKILEEKRCNYKNLTEEYCALDVKLTEQERNVVESKNEVAMLYDLINDGGNIVIELNQKIHFSEMEISRKTKEIEEAAKIVTLKSAKLRAEEISKEKKKALTFQIKLLNLEMRLKKQQMEELRALHFKTIAQLELREYDISLKKNEIAAVEEAKYRECKKEIDITMAMEVLNKKMFNMRQEIFEMKILKEDAVAKIASLQEKLDDLVKSWGVLVVEMSQENQYVDVLTVFKNRVMEEKRKTESGIPLLVKKRENLNHMINEMSRLKLRN